MRTNTLLTYLLYALVVGLFAVVGFKACQMKQDQTRLAKDSADFQKTLKDYGYNVETDTAESRYTGENTPQKPAPATNAAANDGIEYDEDPAPARQPPDQSAPAPKSAAPAPPASENTSAIRDLDTDSADDGRFRVIAGSFRRVDGARREMERIIKMGYHDAEIGYFNRHTYAVVVVKRTNSLSEAKRIAGQLERKGIDVRVVDRQRK